MAASSTEICNLALSHLGIGNEIANLETERSAEAEACRRFYDAALDQALRDFDWPFASRIATLALIEADPTDEWGYSYAAPSDAVYLRRIPSGVRNDTRDSRVGFRLVAGGIIYSDQDLAQIEYTARITDPLQYPADFTLAFSLLLASYIGPRVTGGDPWKLTERSYQRYQTMIGQAKENASTESQPDRDVESEFIRARE